MGELHAAQNVLGLGELDVVVADDLEAVAPGIAKIEEASRQRLDSCLEKRLAHRFLVVDHQTEMTAVIGRLPTALLKRQELISEIDESGIAVLAAQGEVEEAAVKRERLVDVADFERDVVDADGAGLGCGHWCLLSVDQT